MTMKLSRSVSSARALDTMHLTDEAPAAASSGRGEGAGGGREGPPSPPPPPGPPASGGGCEGVEFDQSSWYAFPFPSCGMLFDGCGPHPMFDGTCSDLLPNGLDALAVSDDDDDTHGDNDDDDDDCDDDDDGGGGGGDTSDAGGALLEDEWNIDEIYEEARGFGQARAPERRSVRRVTLCAGCHVRHG